MSSTILCHQIKSITVRVTQHSTFFDTRFTLIDTDGHEYDISALSAKQIAIEHLPMQVIRQKEAA